MTECVCVCGGGGGVRAGQSIRVQDELSSKKRKKDVNAWAEAALPHHRNRTLIIQSRLHPRRACITGTRKRVQLTFPVLFDVISRTKLRGGALVIRDVPVSVVPTQFTRRSRIIRHDAVFTSPRKSDPVLV